MSQSMGSKAVHSLLCCTTLLAHLLYVRHAAASMLHSRAPKGKLVWKETFDQGPHGSKPDPAIWGYEQGDGGWGNGELERYCAWSSREGGCDPSQPNAFVGKDRMLHLVARRTADGYFTSARLITLGKREFQYGRIEVRARVPPGQGIWPAIWMLGADIAAVPWPASGEIDIMENLGREPRIIHGTLHGKGFPSSGYGKISTLKKRGNYADAFHNYGILWTRGCVAFYVDDPAKPYATYTPQDLAPGATWPFDDRSFYLLLNVAVGGHWPGLPGADTVFPAEMLVQSIKQWRLE